MDAGSTLTSFVAALRILALSTLFILPSAYGQETENTQGDTSSEDEIERVEVTGRGLDTAMQAFRSGNFELAEIEFQKNAKCALRLERNERAFIEGLRNGQIDQEVQGGAPESARTAQGNASSLTGSFGGNARSTESNKVKGRTCSDRGQQLYMVGLSQIQLGKTEEAEESLLKAANINRNLYDAYYRVALMQLLRNDRDSAKKQFLAMQRILKKCESRSCNEKSEIIARVNFIEQALDGKVKLD